MIRTELSDSEKSVTDKKGGIGKAALALRIAARLVKTKAFGSPDEGKIAKAAHALVDEALRTGLLQVRKHLLRFRAVTVDDAVADADAGDGDWAGVAAWLGRHTKEVSGVQQASGERKKQKTVKVNEKKDRKKLESRERIKKINAESYVMPKVRTIMLTIK